jgi:phosphatidylglycerol:prolipoprotein diacylglycerol transferase
VECQKAGLDTKVMIDTSILILIAAIVGAKLFYVVGHLPSMIAEPSRLIDVLRAGGVFQGGLICAAIAGIWYLLHKKQNVWLFTDCVAPAIAMGQSIGRLGCLATGCCYGKPCGPDLPWAVVFENSSIGPNGVPLHPVALYETILMAIVFVILMLVWRKRAFDGQIFWIYVIIHSIVRGGIIEWFRGDHGPVFIGLTGQQLISVFTFIVGIIMYIYLAKKSKKKAAA